jgi:hypothetical protein
MYSASANCQGGRRGVVGPSKLTVVDQHFDKSKSRPVHAPSASQREKLSSDNFPVYVDSDVMVGHLVCVHVHVHIQCM